MLYPDKQSILEGLKKGVKFFRTKSSSQEFILTYHGITPSENETDLSAYNELLKDGDIIERPFGIQSTSLFATNEFEAFLKK